MKTAKAKIYTITSVKGGTGKTTFLLSFAGILSRKKQKTLIIDLDLTGSSIAPSLNIPNDRNVFNLADDMMNNRLSNIDSYITSYNEYIDVLPASNDPRDKNKIHYQFIESIIKQLSYKYDYVLIDTNHVMDVISSVAIDNSDEALYIMTDDLMDLKNMKTMTAIYRDMNLNNYKIVLNETFKRNYTDLELNTILGRKIDYIIPETFYDENLSKYVYEGKILTIEKPKKKGNITLEKMIDKLIK